MAPVISSGVTQSLSQHFFRLLASFHSWVAAAVDLLLRRQMMPLTLNVDRAGTVTFVFNIDEILNVA